MELNGYPVLIPINLTNGDYALRFNGNEYKLVPLEMTCQCLPHEPAVTSAVDLDSLVLEKMAEDPSYLKRINMKIVNSKRKTK